MEESVYDTTMNMKCRRPMVIEANTENLSQSLDKNSFIAREHACIFFLPFQNNIRSKQI